MLYIIVIPHIESTEKKISKWCKLKICRYLKMYLANQKLVYQYTILLYV